MAQTNAPSSPTPSNESGTPMLHDQNAAPKVTPATINKKVVVVGDGGCGKTCLLMSYANDSFSMEYIPTVFDNFDTHVEFNGKSVLLSLWDTAGQAEYDRLRPLSYSDTDVFLLVFSLTSEDTLVNVIDKWYPEIKQYCPGVPFIIVGTKLDLRADELKKDHNRAVSSERVMVVAKQISAAAHCECSAKTRQGIKEVFNKALEVSINKVTAEAQPAKSPSTSANRGSSGKSSCCVVL